MNRKGGHRAARAAKKSYGQIRTQEGIAKTKNHVPSFLYCNVLNSIPVNLKLVPHFLNGQLIFSFMPFCFSLVLIP